MTTQTQLKGMHNSTRMINGVHIAYKAFALDGLKWLIIENEDTWQDVAQDNFTPILAFRTQAELIKALNK